MPPSAPAVEAELPEATPEPADTSLDSETGESEGLPPWFIPIIILAVAATLAGYGTFYLKRRGASSDQLAVQRSREFNRWH